MNKKKKNTINKKATSTSKKRKALPTFSGGPGEKLVLYVGNGLPRKDLRLHRFFKTGKWKCYSIDGNSANKPDIVTTLADISMIPEASFDALYLPDVLQTVPFHEIETVLQNLLKTLKKDGILLLNVPNLKKIGEVVNSIGLERTLAKTHLGEAAAIDLIYGYRRHIEAGYTQAMHRTGFVPNTLANKLIKAGFAEVTVQFDGVRLAARAFRRENPSQEQLAPRVVDEDINAMMLKRDALEVEPEQKYNFNFKK